MVLAFPTGRLETLGQRAIVIAGYMDVLLVRAAVLPARGRSGQGPARASARRTRSRSPTCPTSPTSSTTRSASSRRCCSWRRSSCCCASAAWAAPRSGARRRRCSLASLAAASLMTLTALLEVGGAPKAMSELASLLATVAFAVLPYAFLAGLVRSRYSRAGAVGELIERLNAPTSAESLRDALATALGDRGLGLVYWRESVGHYVDYDGRPVELPGARARAARRPRSSATAGASGRSSTTRRWPRSARWCARRRRRRRSRSTTSAWRPSCARAWRSCTPRAPGWSRSSMFERRRLERDLHDGAQQRLVALSLQLGLARRADRRRQDRAGGGDARHRAGGARAGAGGAARARARHPSGRPDRARAAGCAGGPRRSRRRSR